MTGTSLVLHAGVSSAAAVDVANDSLPSVRAYLHEVSAWQYCTRQLHHDNLAHRL